MGQRTGRTIAARTEKWEYDPYGRVLTHTDFKEQVTRYVYDDSLLLDDSPYGTAPIRRNLGRLIEERRYASTNAYNQGRGTPDEVTRYSYDEPGRQSEVNEWTSGNPSLHTTYTYDPVTGAATQIDSALSGVINYDYDEVTGRHTRTYTASNDTSYVYGQD